MEKYLDVCKRFMTFLSKDEEYASYIQGKPKQEDKDEQVNLFGGSH